ncbi:hypothetical protein ABK040_005303 [Willaertia magna]
MSNFIIGIDHVRFHVGNALETAKYYISHLGFHSYAYDGLETGNKDFCTQVVKQNNIIIAFTSALHKAPTHEPNLIPSLYLKSKITTEKKSEDEITKFYRSLQNQGSNHVHDVALLVHNVQLAYEKCCSQSDVTILNPPTKLYFDEEHYVEFATIASKFGESAWVHTLLNRDHQGEKYKNYFLPGFKAIASNPTTNNDIGLQFIDHIAFAIEKDSLLPLVDWYNRCLGFERFYNYDDETKSTGINIESNEKNNGGLTTMVVAPPITDDHVYYHAQRLQKELIANEIMKRMIKFVFVEPVNTNHSKSQIQEFLDFHDGPGVAHLAVHTEDIIRAISSSKKAGVEYITVPHTYYEDWRTKRKDKYELVKEDWSLLEENTILVDGITLDSDDNFLYLLQTFTKPLEDRPTFYFELISRRGNSGFGKGNIKALFDAIERLQLERGTLFTDCAKQE